MPFRQSVQGTIVASSGDVVIPGVLAGSLLVVFVRGNNGFGGGAWTISDDKNAGNYDQDQIQSHPSSGVAGGIFSKPNSAAGTVTVHVVETSGSAVQEVAVHEYTGMVLTSPKDVSSAATGTGTAASSGLTGTTSQADEIVVGNVLFPGPDDNNNVVGGSLTNLREFFDRHWTGDGISSTIGTKSAAFTLGASHPWVCCCVTYKVAASSAITGAISASFTVNGVLTVKGVLTSTLAQTMNLTGALTGKGALTSVVSNVFALSGALTGKGALASAMPQIYSISGVFRAGIPGAISYSFLTTGALTGRGALTSVVSSTYSLSAAFSGSSALSTTITQLFSFIGSLTGLGALAATIPEAFTLTGALTGKGALTGAMSATFGISGVLTGKGALAGMIPMSFSALGALGGGGAMTGAIPLSMLLTGGISSFSAITGSISLAFALTAAPTLRVPGAMSMAFGLTGNLYGLGKLQTSIGMMLGMSGFLQDSNNPLDSGLDIELRGTYNAYRDLIGSRVYHIDLTAEQN